MMLEINKYKDFRVYLEKKIMNLNGDWVNQNNNYEHRICDILCMELSACRYWDAKYDDLYLEFKKGKSIWLDLVRYSEIFLKTNKDAEKETFNLFFIPDKQRTKIEKILGVETSLLIKELKLNRDVAENLIYLEKHLPRSLNAQASLTVNDISRIANFVINI